MSAEFMTEYNDNTISSAIENMEGTIANFDSVGEYILEIQNRYANIPNGRAEIHQMIRAAQLITNRPRGDFSKEVQAVYHGELLGLELINYLEPDNGNPYKGGFAQSFIKQRLDESRPMGEHVETFFEYDRRLTQLSRNMQINLSPPIDNGELNPLYEKFGWKVASEYTDNLPDTYFAMMGFRMIVTEALSPSLPATTDQILNLVNKILKNTVSIEELGILKALEDPELENMLNELQEVKWEGISGIQKKLLNKYKDIEKAFKGFEVPNSSVLLGVKRYIETQLTLFNRHDELIGAKDLLRVTGDLFVVANDEDDKPEIVRTDENVEIRGMFGGIHVVEVPPNKALLRAITHPELYKKEKGKLILAPAIRIIDPVFTTYTSHTPKASLSDPGLTIDIPLIYKTVSLERIKPDTLENNP